MLRVCVKFWYCLKGALTSGVIKVQRTFQALPKFWHFAMAGRGLCLLPYVVSVWTSSHIVSANFIKIAVVGFSVYTEHIRIFGGSVDDEVKVTEQDNGQLRFGD